MNARLVLAIIIGSIGVGCAAPGDQQPARSTAQASQPQEKCYSSGSRLPSTDCGGSSTVGGQSGDDYRQDRASSPTGLQR